MGPMPALATTPIPSPVHPPVSLSAPVLDPEPLCSPIPATGVRSLQAAVSHQPPASVHPSGKLEAPVVSSQAAGGNGFMGLVGDCPVAQVRVGGQTFEGLIDTGSQITTLTEAYLSEHHPDLPIVPINCLTIRAANGQPIPYKGVVTLDIHIFGQDLDSVPVLVTNTPLDVAEQRRKKKQPAIIGMNVLSRVAKDVDVKSLPTVLQPFIQEARLEHNSVRGQARAAEGARIPALSVATLRVTGVLTPRPQPLLATPLARPLPGGLLIVPTLVSSDPHSRYVRIANLSSEDYFLQRRTPVALLHAISGVESGVHQVTVDQHGVSIQEATTAPESSGLDFDAVLGNSFQGSKEQRSCLQSLLEKYSHVFARNDQDLGYTDVEKHRIPTTDDVPVAQPYRSIPPNQFREVQQHIKSLLDAGIIKESRSPYASPVVLVRKKNNELRLCVDFRRLNSKTVGDAFPLPRIQESFDALAGAQFFTTLDLAAGYHQIAMHEDDQHKTAFVTPMGLFEYTRMPFGLCSAPATFQRLMQASMSEFLLECLLVYLDDLLVYSKTFEGHLLDLENILAKIGSLGLKLRLDKCQFLCQKVQYLGHTITPGGIDCSEDKVEVIQNWPTPRTTKDLRSFLGFCSYYRRFLEGFSKIAAPLHDLVNEACTKPGKKRAKVADLTELWSPKHQEAFEELKAGLSSAPTLAYADFTKPFIVETDASHEGLGAILSQKQDDGKTRPIAFASRRLRENEKQYHHISYKLEFLAIKWAVTEKFRHYLIGATFTIFTDNNPLAHYQTTKLGALEQRWASQLAQFNFDCQYKPGKKNPADALSRLPQQATEVPLQVALCHQAARFAPEVQSATSPDPTPKLPDTDALPWSTAVVDSLSHDELRQRQEEDPTIGPVLAAWPDLPATPKPRSRLLQALIRQHPRLKLRNRVLYRQVTDPKWGPIEQLVLPDCLHEQALEHLHQGLGHQGVERTTSLLRARVYWPGLHRSVEQHIQQCARCLLNKKQSVHTPSGHLLASRPLQVIAIDFDKLEMSSDGRENVLVITDVFTKFTQAVPTKSQDALTVAKALVQHWFQRYGVPERIHSDQGRNFESALIATLCQMYGTLKSRTTAYNPAGNGQCERFNSTMHNLLRKLATEQKSRWPDHLPELVQAYNVTPHASTGFTPYFLFFGREPRLPIDDWLQLPSAASAKTIPDWVQQHHRRLQTAHELANKNLLHAASARENYTDHNTAEHRLEEGNFVYLPNRVVGRNKMQDRWHPTLYVVTKPLDNHLYRVKPYVGGGDEVIRSRRELLRVSSPFVPPELCQPPAPALDTAPMVSPVTDPADHFPAPVPQADFPQGFSLIFPPSVASAFTPATTPNPVIPPPPSEAVPVAPTSYVDQTSPTTLAESACSPATLHSEATPSTSCAGEATQAARDELARTPTRLPPAVTAETPALQPGSHDEEAPVPETPTADYLSSPLPPARVAPRTPAMTLGSPSPADPGPSASRVAAVVDQTVCGKKKTASFVEKVKSKLPFSPRRSERLKLKAVRSSKEARNT